MFARSLVTPHQAQLLEDRARHMRCSPTRSEEWLWRRLSGSKTGFAFRRQLVIGPYIADLIGPLPRGFAARLPLIRARPSGPARGRGRTPRLSDGLLLCPHFGRRR